MTTEIICGIEFEVLQHLESDTSYRFFAEINDHYEINMEGNETKGYECICCLDDRVLRSIGKSKEEVVDVILEAIRLSCVEKCDLLRKEFAMLTETIGTINQLQLINDIKENVVALTKHK